MADLKGTTLNAARQLYGEDRIVRFRGSYFPFTEPSVEVDMNCILCNGVGCRMCKYTGWLEIAGSGMVHPVVLRNGGYAPDEWSGFAFGMGWNGRSCSSTALTTFGISTVTICASCGSSSARRV